MAEIAAHYNTGEKIDPADMAQHLLDNMVSTAIYDYAAEPALAYMDGGIDVEQLVEQLWDAIPDEEMVQHEKGLLIFSLGQWRRFKEKADADTQGENIYRAMLDLRNATYGLHLATINPRTGMAEVNRVGCTPRGCCAAIGTTMPAPKDGRFPLYEW